MSHSQGIVRNENGDKGGNSAPGLQKLGKLRVL